MTAAARDRAVGVLASDFMQGVSDPVLAFQAVSVVERHVDLTIASLRPGDEVNGCVLVPLKLLTEAHAVMRACGWQLAPVSTAVGDGLLNLAAAEIEEKVRAMLAAAKKG